MAVLWDIIEDVRRRLSEMGCFRSVIIGDGDIPASLMPAARVHLAAATSDFSTGVPIIIDATVDVEIVTSPASEEEDISQLIQNTIETLSQGEYPYGARVIRAPKTTGVSSRKNTARITMTIRWAERSE